jgi:hypothetical protein
MLSKIRLSAFPRICGILGLCIAPAANTLAQAIPESVRKDLDYIENRLTPEDWQQAVCKVVVSGVLDDGQAKTKYGTAFFLTPKFGLTAAHVLKADWHTKSEGVGTPDRTIKLYCPSSTGVHTYHVKDALIDFDGKDVAALLRDVPSGGAAVTLNCAAENAESTVGAWIALSGYADSATVSRGVFLPGIILETLPDQSAGTIRASYNVTEGFSGGPVFDRLGGVLGVHIGKEIHDRTVSSIYTPLSSLSSKLPSSCKDQMNDKGANTCRRECNEKRSDRQDIAGVEGIPKGINWFAKESMEIEQEWKNCTRLCSK